MASDEPSRTCTVCRGPVTLRRANGQLRRTCCRACEAAAISRVLDSLYRKISALEERRRALLARAENASRNRA